MARRTWIIPVLGLLDPSSMGHRLRGQLFHVWVEVPADICIDRSRCARSEAVAVAKVQLIPAE